MEEMDVFQSLEEINAVAELKAYIRQELSGITNTEESNEQ